MALSLSEPFWLQQSENQVDHEPGGYDAGE